MWKLLVRSRWDRRNIGAEVLSYGFEGWKGRVTVGDAVRAMGSQEMGKVVFTGKGTEGWKRGMRDEGMCRVLEECLEMEVERCRGSRWGERGRRRIEEGGGLGRCVVRPAKPVWPWVLVMAIVVAMAGR